MKFIAKIENVTFSDESCQVVSTVSIEAESINNDRMLMSQKNVSEPIRIKIDITYYIISTVPFLYCM